MYKSTAFAGGKGVLGRGARSAARTGRQMQGADWTGRKEKEARPRPQLKKRERAMHSQWYKAARSKARHRREEASLAKRKHRDEPLSTMESSKKKRTKL